MLKSTKEPSKRETQSSIDSETRFKSSAKRRAAAWQQVLRCAALIKQDAPNLNEWRKKIGEIDSFRRISADLAQKLQQSRSDGLLKTETHRNDLERLRKQLAVLSADLAASQDKCVKYDVKIVQLAANLAKEKQDHVNEKKRFEALENSNVSLRRELEIQQKQVSEIKEKFERSEKRRKAAELLLDEESKAKALVETKAEETHLTAVSLAEKMSSEKAELNRHVVNLSVENKTLKTQIESLKVENAECRENAKLDAKTNLQEQAELRTMLAATKAAYVSSQTSLSFLFVPL